jgi:beta-lactamase superfamily II metal-dependent hydrolase
MNMFTIEMLPANEGDALWIEYGPDAGSLHRILIDCGRKGAYRAVIDRLSATPDIKFELFVLTHVDADHIEGAIPLLQDARFKPGLIGDVWFNEYRHLKGERVVVDGVPDDQLGGQQGEYFAGLLRGRKFRWNHAFQGAAVVVPDSGPLPEVVLPSGMKLTLLSPNADGLKALRKRWEDDLVGKSLKPGEWERALELLSKERRLAPDALGKGEVAWPPDIRKLADSSFDGDGSEPNGSSIAFVAEYEDKRVLFAGDAHAPVLSASVDRMLAGSSRRRLGLRAFKLGHHGSKYNLSKELLGCVDCGRYLVSTNGTIHHHPDPEAIARVLTFGGKSPELVFNYYQKEQKRWDDDHLRGRHSYTTVFPKKGEEGWVKVEV